jgi:hypothetical protein
MFKALWEKILNEPVLMLNLVNAGIALAVAFGLDWTPEQKAGVIGIVTVLMNLIARAKVTPTRKLNG